MQALAARQQARCCPATIQPLNTRCCEHPHPPSTRLPTHETRAPSFTCAPAEALNDCLGSRRLGLPMWRPDPVASLQPEPMRQTMAGHGWAWPLKTARGPAVPPPAAALSCTRQPGGPHPRSQHCCWRLRHRPRARFCS